MTAFDRIERRLPELIDELACGVASLTTSTTCSGRRAGSPAAGLEQP